MFKSIVQALGTDKDYPPRAILIDMFTRVLEGRLYDHIPYPFYREYEQDRYIPLVNRRPSVRYPLCRMVVDDSVSLTFSDDHFPEAICSHDKTVQDFIKDILDHTSLKLRMIEAATAGSVGSVVVIMRILEGKLFWEVKNTQYLTPIYNPANPEALLRLQEKYKVKAGALKALGYNIDEPNDGKDYWFIREWDAQSEIYYNPYPVTERDTVPTVDTLRTVVHHLGFVPAVWIKNLPKPNSIDGYCTFELAIDSNIELDYQLSQAGRGLKYSSDPTTVLKLDDSQTFNEVNAVQIADSPIILPDGSSATIQGAPMGNASKRVVRSSNNALVVSKEEDVEMLEISGEACKAVLEYVRTLREFALEGIHGNRANADKVNAAQSGKAMQAMNQPLIWLAAKFRITYGQFGLLPLLEMALKATRVYEIILNNTIYKDLNQRVCISLKWPHWYPNTPADKQQIANTVKTLTDTQVMSKRTATQTIADDYNISDIEEEETQIAHDQAALQAQSPKLIETISA